MRALIIVVVAACSTQVVDLGKAPDAAIDASPVPATCQCRIPCSTSTVACGSTGMACGSDGFCVGSVGTCTPTTPLPCNVDYPNSICVRSDSATAVCTF